MTKQINLVINGKGGVGKSFFATNFVQYLKDRGIDHRAIDSDHENSTLKRFHSERPKTPNAYQMQNADSSVLKWLLHPETGPIAITRSACSTGR